MKIVLHCRASKVTYVLRLFDFCFFFRLSFFSLSFLFAAVIDLLLGLLASSRRATFTMERPGVVAANFGLSFGSTFWAFSCISQAPLG